MKYLIEIITDNILFNLRNENEVIEYEIGIFKQRIDDEQINNMELIIANSHKEIIVSLFDNDSVYRTHSNFVKVNNDLQYIVFEIANYTIVKKLEFYFNEDEIKIKEL